MSKKLWSGRFEKGTHPKVDQYTASIHFDHALAFEDILGSLAHIEMLKHCKILSEDEHQRIQQGLREIAQQIEKQKITWQVKDEDIHMNIERILKDRIGDVAGKLHTARSRNDQVALDIHLYLRQTIVVIVDILIQLQETLLQIGQTHRETIMPGYTHLQRAQPIYLAQHLMAYVNMFQRDIERLQENWKRTNQSPLGACALAGTTFPINREFTASLLGFDGVYHNTLDAVSDRDFVIEFLSSASIIAMHLSRLSEELILWSSQEFNFISFDDAFCTGSSIMPQKKNPDIAELARGKTGRVYAALLTVLTVLKGLPLAYNKDLQEDKEPLFDVVKTLRQTLTLYIPLLSTMTINTKVMHEAAHTGYLNATALAEVLVKQGVAFREAHEVTGKIVALCIKKGSQLEAFSINEIKKSLPTILNQDFHIPSIQYAVSNCNQSKQSSIDIEFSTYQSSIKKTKQWSSEKNKLLTTIYSKFHIPFGNVAR